MSSLKIRASFGQLGNQQGSNYYPYISAMSGKLTSWIVNGEKSVAYSSPAAVSEDLTWETVQTTDVGIDMGFWDSRINLTGDFYIRDTKDMLVPGVVLPSVFGTASPQQNAGDLRTMGYELALSFNDERKVLGKPFSYGFNFSFGDSVSEITKFDNPTKSLTTYYEGMRIGEIWGYKVSLFQSDAEAAAYTVDQSLVNKKLLASPSVEWNHYRGGDVKFHDLKEDGIIDQGLYTVDDPGDLAIIGNSQARYNYSFGLNMSWCGVDFSAFFQGIGHQDWYPDKESYGFWGPLSRPYWSFLRKSLSLCTCIGTQRFIVKIMAVIQITSREFREKQASMFALADKGAQVVIRRRGKVSYLLTPVYDNDYVLSPEVEERLEEGRKQYKEGNVTTCRTKEELNDFLESL